MRFVFDSSCEVCPMFEPPFCWTTVSIPFAIIALSELHVFFTNYKQNLKQTNETKNKISQQFKNSLNSFTKKLQTKKTNNPTFYSPPSLYYFSYLKKSFYFNIHIRCGGKIVAVTMTKRLDGTRARDTCASILFSTRSVNRAYRSISCESDAFYTLYHWFFTRSKLCNQPTFQLAKYNSKLIITMEPKPKSVVNEKKQKNKTEEKMKIRWCSRAGRRQIERPRRFRKRTGGEEDKKWG